MAEVKRDEFDEERERREYRRRRRIRNQVIAYVFAVLILAALVVGAVIGIRRLVAFVNDKKQEKELQEQMEECRILRKTREWWKRLSARRRSLWRKKRIIWTRL